MTLADKLHPEDTFISFMEITIKDLEAHHKITRELCKGSKYQTALTYEQGKIDAYQDALQRFKEIYGGKIHGES